MDETLPAAMIAQLHALGQALLRLTQTHRDASLATLEQAVLDAVRAGLLTTVVQASTRALQEPHCYWRQRCPGSVDGVVIVNRPDLTAAIVRQCAAAGVPRVWMHQSLKKAGTSVSPEAVRFCQDHRISVIAGVCPMMYVRGADLGHRCMRWMLRLTGGLPK